MQSGKARRTDYLYPLKVWIMTVLISPILIVLTNWLRWDSESSGLQHQFDWYLILVVFGSVYAIPALCVIHVLYVILARHVHRTRVLRRIMVLSAIGTVIMTSYVLNFLDSEFAWFALAYIVVVAGFGSILRIEMPKQPG